MNGRHKEHMQDADLRIVYWHAHGCKGDLQAQREALVSLHARAVIAVAQLQPLGLGQNAETTCRSDPARSPVPACGSLGSDRAITTGMRL